MTNTIYGQLDINHETGTVTFRSSDGRQVLRVTHLKIPVPQGAGIDIVALDKLTSYESLAWEEPDRSLCPTCRTVHNDNEKSVFKDGDGKVVFRPGHEYVVRTKTKQQKFPREWRMGYIGRYKLEPDSKLQFTARGPERATTPNHYGGTVTLDYNEIIEVTEVNVDHFKRQVGLMQS